MIVTVTSYKGGVAKTTTAVHLAAYLAADAPTLLIDGDLNRSALQWAQKGLLPFRVVDERQGARFARDFAHIIIDTPARPTPDDLKVLSGGCDLLVIPTTPDALALQALRETVQALREISADSYRILLTIVPPRPARDAEEARAMLAGAGIPLFESEIPRLSAFSKAALTGAVVSQVADPRAVRAWESYTSAGKELLHDSRQKQV